MSQANPILNFLEFVESQPHQSVRQLMNKILLKSRMMTGAEAGSIFIVRQKGAQRWLAPESMQNDRLRVRFKDFVVPITPKSIAGFVASSAETLIIDDVYDIPSAEPYSFNPDNELPGYRTKSIMCFPLDNYQDKVIGVVQLINRVTRPGGPPLAFTRQHASLVLPIARTLAGHIERADMVEHIRQKNAKLRQRNRELAVQRAQVVALQAETEEAFMMSINLLARAAEIHDEETGNHIVRCNEYAYFLAREMGMPKAFCEEIRYSAQLHDVGKMSVNSAVLKKKGRLTDEERHEMNSHPTYGYEILRRSPRLHMAAEIALNHHEKWDGTGYPNRTGGDDIPIAARIVALADIYDALRSERPYKPAFSHEKSVDIIVNGDDRIDPASHFDPDLRELFGKRHGGMDEIYHRLAD